MTVFLLASLFGFSGSLLAQIVHTPPDQKQLIIQAARQQLASLPTPVQVHFTNALKDSEKALPAARVLLDMVQQKIENTPDFVYYRVPALSNLQRLPLVYPVDGKIQSAVRSVIAKDEYESCSFEIYPFKDMVLEFTVNDLKNQKQEVLSADKLDLKVVKVWYQNKNAWYSYFSDVGLTLVPELLLKDENLILCKDQSNYARVNRNGKTEYLWINPPHEIDSSYTEISWKHYSSFRFMRENFSDAETLQPVSFTAGNFKQMWLTVHIPQDQPEGLYKGSITVKNHETGKVMQEIPLEIKVLPYVLPQPLAPDMQRDFLVSLYGGPSIGRLLSLNGANRKLAVEQNLKILKNMRAHNLKNPMVENDDFPTLSLHFDQMKEAGMDMKTIIGTNWVFPWEKDKTGNYTQRMYDNGRKDAKAKAIFMFLAVCKRKILNN